jgi:DNA mismatch endonuclease (patch repair protein)
MDTLTREQRRLAMSRIKSSNTSIEVALRKALWHEGIRYRKNLKTLPGKPDIAITKYKIAVFCDGEFWHGKNWDTKKNSIKTNSAYWVSKIERNMDRDNSTDSQLSRLGWTVIHFWGKDIEKHLNDCVAEIKDVIFQTRINADYNSSTYINEELAAIAEETPEYAAGQHTQGN